VRLSLLFDFPSLSLAAADPLTGFRPVNAVPPSLTLAKDPVLEFGKAQGAVCEALDSEE